MANSIMTTAEAKSFVDETPGDAPVRGFLHRAGKSGDGFLVLTHGAGGNCSAPLLVVLAEKFAASGLTVLRCDLPYRQRRPRGAPSPADANSDQAGLLRAVTLMKEQFAGPAFLGGSSYGGRQASMLVASEPQLVEGLLLLSYPLHPPGKPAQLRTAHFPVLRTAVLFVSGTKDAFGSMEEFEIALTLIPARKKLVPVEGAPHGLSQKAKQDQVVELVLRQFETFFSGGRKT
jgi:predicted alpha/beta-hydrolase family hydrolase